MTLVSRLLLALGVAMLLVLSGCQHDDDDLQYRVHFVTRQPTPARTPLLIYVDDDDGRVAAGARVHAWAPEVEHIYGQYPIEVRVDNFGYAEILPESGIPFPVVSGEWVLQVEGDLGQSDYYSFDVLPYTLEIAATRDSWEQGEYIELGVVTTAGNMPTSELVSNTQFALVDQEGNDVFPPSWGVTGPNRLFGFFCNLAPGIYTLEGWERNSGWPTPIREIEVLPAGQQSLGVSRFPKFGANGEPLPIGQLFADWDTFAGYPTDSFFVLPTQQTEHFGGQFLSFYPTDWEPWQQEVLPSELSLGWTPWRAGVFYTAVDLDLPAGATTSAWRRHLVLQHYW